jgi:hypothetical protein
VDELLFHSGYLRDALAHQGERMVEELNSAPEDHLLHVDVDAWAAALAERYQVEAPELAPAEDWYRPDDHAEGRRAQAAAIKVGFRIRR